MHLKARLIEFVIRHNLVPTETKWKLCATGVGRLFRDVFSESDGKQRERLTAMMHKWGIEDSDNIIGMLSVQRNLHGCAVAVIAANQVFGVKSHITRETEDEIIIHATECMWKDMKDWTPAVCASISAYDEGLVEGIAENVAHYFTKRRSQGDRVCELILRKK